MVLAYSMNEGDKLLYLFNIMKPYSLYVLLFVCVSQMLRICLSDDMSLSFRKCVFVFVFISKTICVSTPV